MPATGKRERSQSPDQNGNKQQKTNDSGMVADGTQDSVLDPTTPIMLSNPEETGLGARDVSPAPDFSVARGKSVPRGAGIRMRAASHPRGVTPNPEPKNNPPISVAAETVPEETHPEVVETLSWWKKMKNRILWLFTTLRSINALCTLYEKYMFNDDEAAFLGQSFRTKFLIVLLNPLYRICTRKGSWKEFIMSMLFDITVWVLGVLGMNIYFSKDNDYTAEILFVFVPAITNRVWVPILVCIICMTAGFVLDALFNDLFGLCPLVADFIGYWADHFGLDRCVRFFISYYCNKIASCLKIHCCIKFVSLNVMLCTYCLWMSQYANSLQYECKKNVINDVRGKYITVNPQVYVTYYRTGHDDMFVYVSMGFFSIIAAVTYLLYRKETDPAQRKAMNLAIWACTFPMAIIFIIQVCKDWFGLGSMKQTYSLVDNHELIAKLRMKSRQNWWGTRYWDSYKGAAFSECFDPSHMN
jgi:hypothetical protein